jgi:uncharacterized protein (DUF2236 family)
MTVLERVNGERIVLLGWTRAILLQLAHPLIAAGVAEHSGFRTSSLGSIVRLRRTVRAMRALNFGTDAQRRAALAGIGGIHRGVHGRLREAVGPFPAGTSYSAEDPALLLWVHATLLESIPLVYELLVEPLSLADRDRYCREAAPAARALGADEGVPESWSALVGYLQNMRASGQIVVSGEARTLARAVLSPPFGALVWPATRANRLITIGLLPAILREQYGFDWTARDEGALRRWVRGLRVVRRVAPAMLREWPEARRAFRRREVTQGVR